MSPFRLHNPGFAKIGESDAMLKIPETFLARLREPLDWIDLRYAYAHHLVDGQAVIDHACRVLSETECDNEKILAIASAKGTDLLEPLIDLVHRPYSNFG